MGGNVNLWNQKDKGGVSNIENYINRLCKLWGGGGCAPSRQSRGWGAGGVTVRCVTKAVGFGISKVMESVPYPTPKGVWHIRRPSWLKYLACLSKHSGRRLSPTGSRSLTSKIITKQSIALGRKPTRWSGCVVMVAIMVRTSYGSQRGLVG
jgi:hypothetical protein